MRPLNNRFFVNLSLFNLLIVAFLGVIMRYKIGFEFPYLDQKNLQEGHSHFAFSGWVTQLIIVLLVRFLTPHISSERLKGYYKLIFLHILLAYLTLLSFLWQGYGFISITSSTLSVLVFIIYSIMFYSDSKRINSEHPSLNWFKVAILCNIVSSIGSFFLAYLIYSKNLTQFAYLASVYEYLHFQYNGWFFFSCIGLFLAFIKFRIPVYKHNPIIFWVFAVSIIPAYGLSILWIKLPIWIYIIIILSALGQIWGWIKLIQEIKSHSFFTKSNLNFLGKYLFLILAIALSIKFALQAGSTIPSISKLAFGFRPIVIAYLHLILLAIISVFLITYLYINHLIKINNLSISGIIVLIFGIYLNEIALGVQGIASLKYIAVPFINIILLIISLIILAGIIVLMISQINKKSENKISNYD